MRLKCNAGFQGPRAKTNGIKPLMPVSNATGGQSGAQFVATKQLGCEGMSLRMPFPVQSVGS
jgi:hypothetical protein